jgi:hypothetical protein
MAWAHHWLGSVLEDSLAAHLVGRWRRHLRWVEGGCWSVLPARDGYDLSGSTRLVRAGHDASMADLQVSGL